LSNVRENPVNEHELPWKGFSMLYIDEANY